MGQLNSNVVEERLFQLCLHEIDAFAPRNGRELFYAFAFDCHSARGQVLLCLNTLAHLQAAVGGLHLPAEINDGYDKAKRDIEAALGMKIYGDRSETPPEERADKLRRSLGDWKYQGINSPRFEAEWEDFETEILLACVEEEEDPHTFMTPTQVQFMDSCCRVIIRLENQRAFDLLSRTNDFSVYVADHDDTENEARARLESVRSKAEKA